KLKQIKDDVTQFFQNYSKTHAENLRERIQTTLRTVEAMKRAEEKLINMLTQVETDIETAGKDINEKNDVQQGVTDKLTKLREIFRLTRDINELTTKQIAREQEMIDYDKKMNDMKRTIKRYEDDIMLLEERIN